MNKTTKMRKTAILTLVIASFLFTAGAGQAMALERGQDGDFSSNVVINLLERIGEFVSDVAVEVVEVFTKVGASPTQDG